MRAVRNWTETRWALAFVVGIDLVAIFDAYALGYLCRFEWGFVLPPLVITPSPVEYLKAWVLAMGVAVVQFQAYGLYDQRRYRAPLECLTPLLRALAIGLGVVLVVSYFYRRFSYSRVSVAYTATFAVLLVGAFRLSWERYRADLRRRSGSLTPVLLVGSRQVPQFLAARIAENPGFGYRLVGVVDDIETDDPSWDDSDSFAALRRGHLDDVGKWLDRGGIDEVLVGHPALGHHRLLELIATCEQRSVRIRMVPATYDLLVDIHDLEEVEGIPLVTINEQRIRPLFHFAKRVFDILASSLLIVLTLPILAVAALAIRLESRSSAFFTQRRVGKNGEPFTMFKLRTMVADAEQRLDSLVDIASLEEPVFKLESDPRVTRVGRVLRRTSIDELPQLFNVWRGDMSLVGPRPEEERVVEHYDVWEKRRLKLRPGITGLQQLHSRGSCSLKERVRWDILYLRRESLLLDLWILMRTVGAVIRGKGAR